MKTTTKFIRANDQLILNGKLYQFNQSSELPAGRITFQLVEAKGKQRIEEFKLELNEFEQLDDTFILLEAKIRRKGEGLLANFFKIINRIENTKQSVNIKHMILSNTFVNIKHMIFKLVKVEECKN